MGDVRRRQVASEQVGELQVKTSEPKDKVSEHADHPCMETGCADFPRLASKHRSRGSGQFDMDLWLVLTLESWLFDFGRPIYALYVSDVFPLSLPSIGETSITYCLI